VPTFTAECIGSTPSSGIRKFITVNADFLISPAYIVPAMRISFRARCRRIAVSLRVPSIAGSARNEGASMIVKFGTNSRRDSRDGRMNRLRAKMLAHAVSVYTRRLRRCAGCAPT
jgi:hypothetical protein